MKLIASLKLLAGRVRIRGGQAEGGLQRIGIVSANDTSADECDRDRAEPEREELVVRSIVFLDVLRDERYACP